MGSKDLSQEAPEKCLTVSEITVPEKRNELNFQINLLNKIAMIRFTGGFQRDQFFQRLIPSNDQVPFNIDLGYPRLKLKGLIFIGLSFFFPWGPPKRLIGEV